MKTDPIDQAPSLLAYPVHSRHVCPYPANY
jgi:hypothetical protein